MSMTNCVSNSRRLQLLNNNINYLQDSLPFRMPELFLRRFNLEWFNVGFCWLSRSPRLSNFYFQPFSLSLSLMRAWNQRDRTNKFSGHREKSSCQVGNLIWLETFRQPPVRDARKKFDGWRSGSLPRPWNSNTAKEESGYSGPSFSIFLKQRAWYTGSWILSILSSVSKFIESGLREEFR